MMFATEHHGHGRGVGLIPTGRFTAVGGHPVTKVILPEKVRERYQRRHGFARF